MRHELRKAGQFRSRLRSRRRQNLPEGPIPSLHDDLPFLSEMIPDQQNHARAEGDEDQQVEYA